MRRSRMSRKRERGFEAEESSQETTAGRAGYSSPKRLRGINHGLDGPLKVCCREGLQGGL
jgi:hypothetical protein